MSQTMHDEPVTFDQPTPPAPPAPEARPVFRIPEYLANDTAATPALNEAIANVLAETCWVDKRGYNDFHKYAYATIDDLREHVGKILGKHGLSYEQHEVDIATAGTLLKVTYIFRINHKSGESGPFEKVTALAMANNRSGPDDKAVSKTRSLALKDWVKSRFSIPTGDEVESAGGDEPDADASHPLHGKPPARQDNKATKGNAMDKLAAKVAPAAAQPQQQQPRADQSAQDQQRQQKAQAFADHLKRSVHETATISPDAEDALVSLFSAEKNVNGLAVLRQHFPALYDDVCASCAQQEVIGKIVGIKEKFPVLHNDIIAASQKQAA